MIEELLGKVFATRNAAHLSHLTLVKSGFHHVALGKFYDQIIDAVDEIVEVYQGRNGLLDPVKIVSVPPSANFVTHIRSEAEWIERNRDDIAEGSETIGALIDTLAGLYFRTVYKLENLK